MDAATQARTDLSVHPCRDSGFRVERRLSGRNAERAPMQWVPTAQCVAMGRWIEAAARVRLPAPMLRPHRTASAAPGATWYILNAGSLSGRGSLHSLELEILDPPGAAPNALGAWIRDGERIFQSCRDLGHGGEGYLPFGRRPRP